MLRLRKRCVVDNICCFSYISILMNKWHSHSCVTIDWVGFKRITLIIEHVTIIKCVFISWIIKPSRNCKIIRVYTRKGCFRKHIPRIPINILNEITVIIINIIRMNVTSVSFDWLRWPVLNPKFWPKFCDAIWVSKVFSTKRIGLIIIW